MKIIRILKLNNCLIFFISFILLNFVWQFSILRKIQGKPSLYIFDEKPILNDIKVQFYTKQELAPALGRPENTNDLVGEGGNGVLATSAGSGFKYVK